MFSIHLIPILFRFDISYFCLDFYIIKLIIKKKKRLHKKIHYLAFHIKKSEYASKVIYYIVANRKYFGEKWQRYDFKRNLISLIKPVKDISKIINGLLLGKRTKSTRIPLCIRFIFFAGEIYDHISTCEFGRKLSFCLMIHY